MRVRSFQVTMDCLDPRALGAFWAEVLGYVEDPPPPGFAFWPEALTAWGVPEEQHNSAYALVDPEGNRPRVFFQQVPESKTTKNRVHLDVRVTGVPGADDTKGEPLEAEARRLVALGATHVETVRTDRDFFVVMQDPEGNEFCVT